MYLTKNGKKYKCISSQRPAFDDKTAKYIEAKAQFPRFLSKLSEQLAADSDNTAPFAFDSENTEWAKIDQLHFVVF